MTQILSLLPALIQFCEWILPWTVATAVITYRCALQEKSAVSLNYQNTANSLGKEKTCRFDKDEEEALAKRWNEGNLDAMKIYHLEAVDSTCDFIQK